MDVSAGYLFLTLECTVEGDGFCDVVITRNVHLRAQYKQISALYKVELPSTIPFNGHKLIWSHK
jgi:hypothetical protein